MVDLRPYQIEAKEALRAKMREGLNRLVLCMPTGSGKTEVAMSIATDVIAKGRGVLFVVDRQNLVRQTSERFFSAGIPHGVLMGQDSFGLSEAVIVASVQTMEARGYLTAGRPLDEVGTFKKGKLLVVIDECHEIRRKLVDHIVQYDIKTIGLSASPVKAELGLYYQGIVNATTTNALVGAGWLSPIKVVSAISEVDVEGLKIKNGEWIKTDLSDRIKYIVGDVVPEWEKQTDAFFGRRVPTIVFCASVGDAEALAERFQDAGHNFQVVHYRQDSDEKMHHINTFKGGGYDGLISCVALTKGFDAPLVQCLVDVYPLNRSLSMHIQKMGRLMRIADGKDFGLLIDHAGNWLGFAAALKAFYASGIASLGEGRFTKAKRTPKEQTQDMKCFQCGFVWPEGAQACPACGVERRRRETTTVIDDVEMGEIDGVDGAGGEFGGNWWVEICAVVSQTTVDPAKGHKMALAKYRDIFKTWPPWGTRFEYVDRPPHPVVADTCYRHYQRWLIANKKRKEKHDQPA